MQWVCAQCFAAKQCLVEESRCYSLIYFNIQTGHRYALSRLQTAFRSISILQTRNSADPAGTASTTR
jgi:hypothetical protein